MKKKTTPSLPKSATDKNDRVVKCPRPRQETITFLQLFARNCHTEPKLPQGLQEIIVG